MDNRIGGPQNRVLSIGKELRKHGIETIILMPKGNGSFASMARNLDFKTYQIELHSPKHFSDLSSIYANIRWIITFPISIIIIAFIIRKEKIDIVQTNGLINLQAPIAAALTRRKVLWYLSSSLFPKFVVLLLVPFIKAISCHIVIISEVLKGYYFGNKLPPNLTLISRSIDTKKFNPDAISKKESDRMKEELDIQPDMMVVGSIGNINPAKGYEYFLEAAKIIKSELGNVRFLIVGDIPESQRSYYSKLVNLASALGIDSDLSFVGKRDDIPQVISIFDLFILSSVSEGGPAVTLEAMAMKKAVIATNVGAVPQQIINHESGVIIDIMDAESMANSAIHLLRNPCDRLRIGKKARERVEKEFSFDNYIELHKEIYFRIAIADS